MESRSRPGKEPATPRCEKLYAHMAADRARVMGAARRVRKSIVVNGESRVVTVTELDYVEGEGGTLMPVELEHAALNGGMRWGIMTPVRGRRTNRRRRANKSYAL